MNSPKSLIARLRFTWLRLIVFAVLWWVLTDGNSGSWGVGIPMVLLVTWISRQLQPPVPLSLRGLLQFIPFFLWRSLDGGVDVVRRVFDPRLPISPGVVDHEWRLPPGFARVLMANTVSLLPGTLCVKLEQQRLYMHVLDETESVATEMALIEERVAKLFGLELMPNRRKTES